MGRIQTVVASTILALLWTSLVRAEDAPLRQQAMRLNDVTGKDSIKGKIRELLHDRAAAKKLIVQASVMSKEKEPPFNYNGAYILAQLAHRTKDFDNSLAFYKLCVDQAVKLRSGQKLVEVYDGLISLFLENKKFDEAVRACQEFLDLKAGKDVQDIKPFVMEQMILALCKSGKNDDALKLTESLVKADEGGWYFVRLKAEVLAEGAKYSDAVGAYEEAISRIKELKNKDGEADKERQEQFQNKCRATMDRVVIEFTRQNKSEEALKLVDELVRADFYFSRLKGEVLRDAGKLNESVAAIEDTIAKIDTGKFDEKQKKAIVERCRYVLSGVLTDLNKIEQAAGQLEILLKDNPENSTYNNDLGYIWADHDIKLDEAEKLVRKALDIDKAERAKLKEAGLLDAADDRANAAYLDSMAWVHFKRKQYAEAKKLLLEASKYEDGQHVEIFDHLAQVQMAMGEKAEALEVWKKALSLDNVSKRDDARKDAVRKRLEKVQAENP